MCVLPQQESKIVPSKSIRAVCNWCCMGTAGWQTDGRDIWSYWRRIKGMLGNWPAWERRIKIGLPPTDAQLSITPHILHMEPNEGAGLCIDAKTERWMNICLYTESCEHWWCKPCGIKTWYNSENNFKHDFYVFHYLCVRVSLYNFTCNLISIYFYLLINYFIKVR